MSHPKDNAPPLSTAPPVPDVGKVRSTVPPIGVEAAVIVKREERKDRLKISSLVLRWLNFGFSFIAFVIMASNRHGYSITFENYEEYSYLLAITVISTVYSAYHGIREIIQLVNAKLTFPQSVFTIIDFIGDQTFAYLLISAASAATPMTNRYRDPENSTIATKFLDMAAASISMAFLAFFTLALSVLISGYKLFTHYFI